MITLNNARNGDNPENEESTFKLTGIDPNMLKRLQDEARRIGVDLNRYILSILKKEMDRVKAVHHANAAPARDEMWINENTERYLRSSEEFYTIDDALWE
jgi:hypothetical protein